ncbi:MAG: flagellar basal body P-ring formation protein FlgA [FCB group bacterium]|nr:flagellar basal body P-ring formation protein FlgA [FCB group bacterium]
MRKLLIWTVILALTVPAAAEGNLRDFLTEKLISDYQLDPLYVDIILSRSAITLTDLSGCEIRAYALTQAEPRGRFPMRVEVYRDGALIDKGSVSLDIKCSADLLVPVRNIKRHEPLTPDLFTLKRFDITKRTERMLGDNSHLQGSRAKQNLTAGRYVPLGRIEIIPDVENGDQVALVGDGTLLDIRVKGVALQNGNIGETIRVKNIDSRKILVGRVKSPGTVEIAL